MGRFIAKLDGHYFEYSTVTDSPVTNGMILEEFRQYYRDQYSASAMEEFEERLFRVEQTGTSSRIHNSVEEMLEGNRGWEWRKTGTIHTRPPHRIKMTIQEIIDEYLT